MSISQKQADSLRPALLKKVRSYGYDGKATDAEAMFAFIEENEIDASINGKSIDKKMLMNILGGSIELEPAEEVAGDEYTEDEPKMMDEEDKPKAADLNRINAKASRVSAPAIINSEFRGYDRKAARGETVFRDGKTAELFYSSLRLGASKGGNFDYPLKSYDEKLLRKAGSTTDLNEGGSLIPVEVQQDIQEIKEQYGVARQLANFTSTPTRAMDITVSDEGDGPDVEWVGENPSSTTEASVTLRPYTVLAKKLFGRYRLSTEIFRTPGIGMVDYVAREFVRSGEKKLDNAYFQGDGTQTYGTHVGVRTKLINNGNVGSNAGLAGTADGTWTAITLADFEEVMGLTGKGDPSSYQWVMGRLFFHQVVLPLIRGVGGTSMVNVEDGPRYMLHGAPVILSDVGFPTAAANNSVVALYGDYRRGSHIHEVSNSSSFSTSEHRYADTDQIGVFYRYEAGMVVYGTGSASESGCIVGLATTS